MVRMPILETLSFDTDPAGAFLLSSPMAKQRQRTRPTDGPRQQLSPGARQLGSASSLEGLTPEQLEFAPNLWRMRAEEARRPPS